MRSPELKSLMPWIAILGSVLKKVVDFLRRTEHMNKPLAEARLVVSGRDVAIVRKGELVSALAKPGKGYLSFVVDLPEMIGELVDLADKTRAFVHGIAFSQVGRDEGRSRKQPVSIGTRRRKRVRG